MDFSKEGMILGIAMMIAYLPFIVWAVKEWRRDPPFVGGREKK